MLLLTADMRNWTLPGLALTTDKKTDTAAGTHNWGSLVLPSEALPVRTVQTIAVGSWYMDSLVAQGPEVVMALCAVDAGSEVWSFAEEQKTKDEVLKRMDVVANPKVLEVAVEDQMSSTCP